VIIAVLVGLLLPLTGVLRRNARFFVSGQHAQSVLHRVSLLAQLHNSVAAYLQEKAGLEGVSSFSQSAGVLAPRTGAWLAYNQPWQLRFPWGRRSLTFATTGRPMLGHPRDFALSQCNPRKSAAILVAAGVVRDVASYASDRSPAADWNDAWGNPLIVSYALFQYGPDTAGSWPNGPFASVEAGVNTTAFTAQWARAEREYQQLRTLYITIGVLGPTISGTYANPATLQAALASATPATSDAAYDTLWSQVNATANRANGAELWRVAYPAADPVEGGLAEPAGAVNPFLAKPWSGSRRAQSGGLDCMLVGPVEVP
jgi:hypothetical protein